MHTPHLISLYSGIGYRRCVFGIIIDTELLYQLAHFAKIEQVPAIFLQIQLKRSSENVILGINDDPLIPMTCPHFLYQGLC